MSDKERALRLCEHLIHVCIWGDGDKCRREPFADTLALVLDYTKRDQFGDFDSADTIELCKDITALSSFIDANWWHDECDHHKELEHKLSGIE